MLRIGIPNRSSLLHVAGASLCIKAKIIDMAAYKPPRLFYRSDKTEVLLTRCDELCKLFSERRLDVILTGFDYAIEHLDNPSVVETPCDVFRTAFALLGAPKHIPVIPCVVTKFPAHAAMQLAAWEVKTGPIRAMTGGVEGVCTLDESVVAFDVICTGATVTSNGLTVYRQDTPRPPLWLSRGSLPAAIECVMNDEALLEQLREFYRRKLAERDESIAAAVSAALV